MLRVSEFARCSTGGNRSRSNIVASESILDAMPETSPLSIALNIESTAPFREAVARASQSLDGAEHPATVSNRSPITNVFITRPILVAG